MVGFSASRRVLLQHPQRMGRVCSRTVGPVKSRNRDVVDESRHGAGLDGPAIPVAGSRCVAQLRSVETARPSKFEETVLPGRSAP